jgi:hypothetical protein
MDSLADWTDIILGKSLCTKCNKLCNVGNRKNNIEFSDCCNAIIERIKCKDSRFNNL